MSSKKLMSMVRAKQKKYGLNCPLRLRSKCHPDAHVEVFIDGKLRKITLSCGKCDRIFGVFQVFRQKGH